MPQTRTPQPRPARVRARASTAHPDATAPVRRRLVGRAGWAWLGVLAVVVLWLAATPAAQAATSHVLAAGPSLDGVLTNIRNFLMGLLGSVTVVCLIVAGIRYVLANGDPGEIDAAKRAFKNGLFGFALAMLAPLLVEILKSIVGS